MVMEKFAKLFGISAAAIGFTIAACASTGTKIMQPQVFPINAPVAGNYPQGLYKYPYVAISTKDELFTQTLEWEPKVNKTFAVNTAYTAVLTLDPVKRYTFKDTTLAEINGLPSDNVENISIQPKGNSLVVRIEFARTAGVNAARRIIFEDNFDGNTLDRTKWDYCPEWDRQGRSSWRDDMVSVSGGMLHLKFKRDPELGRTKSFNNTLANNWIRAGAIRSRTKDWRILFDNTYGYYEARIKFPKAIGTWGAFWLMSPTQHLLKNNGIGGTEIDIVETIGNHEDSYNAALHWNGYERYHKSVGSDTIAEGVNIYDGNFHIFAIDWSPSEYIFYVDGVEFWRVDGGAGFENSGINQNPNYIKLTVESADWSLELPHDFVEDEMLVDYVRVYNQPQITN